MKRILLMADPAEGNGGTPPANPPPAAPASPAAVKGTPIKHPAVIALEKKVAGLEDEVSSFKGWMSEVNTSLEGLNVGAPTPAPVKVKPGTVPAAPATPATPAAPASKSFGQQLDEDIWGKA